MTNYTAEDALDMDNYSINQLDDFFKQHKCEVHIMMLSPKYHGCKWQVILTKEEDGVKVEINTSHVRMYCALYDAYEKFNQIAKKGAPNLLAPVIEHKKLTEEEVNELPNHPNRGDDIPF